MPNPALTKLIFKTIQPRLEAAGIKSELVERRSIGSEAIECTQETSTGTRKAWAYSMDINVIVLTQLDRHPITMENEDFMDEVVDRLIAAVSSYDFNRDDRGFPKLPENRENVFTEYPAVEGNPEKQGWYWHRAGDPKDRCGSNRWWIEKVWLCTTTGKLITGAETGGCGEKEVAKCTGEWRGPITEQNPWTATEALDDDESSETTEQVAEG